MNCKIVFDASTESFHGWALVWIATAVAVVGFALGLIRRHSPPRTRWGWPVLALTWVLLVGGLLAWKQHAASIVLRSGAYSRIDGCIKQIIAAPPNGKGDEILVVDNHRFSYSDLVIRPSLNETARRRAGLAEGQFVSVLYRNNDILRTEVCADPGRSARCRPGR